MGFPKKAMRDATTGKPHAGNAVVAVTASGQLSAVAFGAALAEYPHIAAAGEAWAAMRAVEIVGCAAIIQSGNAAGVA